jgi:hypothetical protein
MMLAEVKVVMDSKIQNDKEKGEETATTKTKCARAQCGAVQRRVLVLLLTAARAWRPWRAACLRRRTRT